MKPYYEDSESGIVIFHCDCRDVLPTLGKVDLVLTDPPYGINLTENSEGGRCGRRVSAWAYGVAGDENQDIGNHVLGWAEQHNVPTVAFASPKKPWRGEWSSWLVWDKGPAVGGGGDVKRCWKQTWELIQVARTGILNGNRDAAVLKFWVGPDLGRCHPAAKPCELIAYLLRKTSQPHDLVFDPFMGSGTTLRAAKDLGRKAIGIEIEERYCEIAANRLAQGVLAF